MACASSLDKFSKLIQGIGGSNVRLLSSPFSFLFVSAFFICSSVQPPISVSSAVTA
ncbi:MAG: hypothetical protein IPO46_06690 [Chitinophagaceae bacterium]|nr:hypothetical protein [Ferruginibacter sp.]NMD28352.1 hypothetical protein [Bacteroidota bacterium]QQS64253.1 MAG: hypothetical protein IPO46_06690 [Chitinophagaceae bacterium]MBP9606429.1 hypothetical protein [Ferruginibacter sp.]HOV44013.1 hypothetical protein [Ferruginibacter sp.]